jgi:hypothetical protein
LREQGLTWTQVAEETGLHREAARSIFRRSQENDRWKDSNDKPELEQSPVRPTYLEAWEAEMGRCEDRPEWRELVEHAKRGAEIQLAYRPNPSRATRRVVTNSPIFVALPADFHLGSPYTDYEAFIATTDLILGDERFYISVVGPDMETAFAWFRSADAVLNQTLPPWLQIELYRQWLDEMLPRTLAVCGDNHSDQRLERMLGDIGILWRDDVPYFRAWGILTIEVGPEGGPFVEYEFALAHKYKGRSIYHDLQPALRMMRDIYPTADGYITAHTHKPFYMAGVFYPEARPLKPTQHFIVTGSFKTGPEPYSMRGFGGSGVLGVPTLALSPGEYQVQYFGSPEVAQKTLG